MELVGSTAVAAQEDIAGRVKNTVQHYMISGEHRLVMWPCRLSYVDATRQCWELEAAHMPHLQCVCRLERKVPAAVTELAALGLF